MNIGSCDRPTLEPRRWLEPHDECAEVDQLVRSEVAQLIDRLKVYGRTVPAERVRGEVRQRYDLLIDYLGDALHDCLPGSGS